MSLIIPAEVLHAAGMTADALRRDLAVMLFQQLLKDRDVPIHRDVEEVQADVETLRKPRQLPWS